METDVPTGPNRSDFINSGSSRTRPHDRLARRASIGRAISFYSCPMKNSIAALLCLLLVCTFVWAQDSQPEGYPQLLRLFEEWRAFERPPLLDGTPDYTTATFDKRQPAFEGLRARLRAIDPSDWPVELQVDWHLVRAEMNGYEFNRRVLRPWARDPAFYSSVRNYRSDVPAHEGPTHHAVTELWTYSFPLGAEEERRLISDLAVIPPLMKQARQNLTGNARDLWVTGIREIRAQREALDGIEPENTELKQAVARAQAATDALIAWLEQQAPKKTGPSGIGKENYTWYLQNVHLVPLTWEDEVRLLKRELDRAWSSLKLEEHRNRHLPPLVPAATPEEYDRMADKAATQFMRFLDEQEIVTVEAYMEPALREQLGSFVPEESRNFFRIAHASRPAAALLAFLPLVRAGADGLGAAYQPDSPGSAALQHLRQPQRGNRHRCRGDVHARRPVRRHTARRASWSGSCWRSAPRVAWGRCTLTPTR